MTPTPVPTFPPVSAADVYTVLGVGTGADYLIAAVVAVVLAASIVLFAISLFDVLR